MELISLNIENEIFKRTICDFNKLQEYGFIFNKDYIFEKTILNNKFKAIVTITKSGKATGKIIDLEVNEEYTNIRTEMDGEFVNKVREEYKKLLTDIKDKCFINKYFINDQTNRITEFINNKYSVNPEFLWEKYPGCAIFRNKNNKKWFATIMNIDLSKIDDGNGEVEIMNVKLDKDKVLELLNYKGYYKAYHSSKKEWISIILNDTLSDNVIKKLISESYNIIANKKSY